MPCRLPIVACCFVCVALPLAFACGGSGASTPRTYVNQDYGFALTYPGSYEQVETKQNAILQQMDFATTLADPGSVDEAKSHHEVVDALLVAASRFPEAMSEAQAQEVLRQTKSQLAGLSGDVPQTGYYDVTATPGTITTMDGAPCLEAELSYANADGARLHDKLYMIISGDLYIALQATAAEDRWPQSGPTLEGIAASFRLL